MTSEPEEIICPACTECSLFTIVNIGIGSWAKCTGCGHLIELELIGRYAT